MAPTSLVTERARKDSESSEDEVFYKEPKNVGFKTSKNHSHIFIFHSLTSHPLLRAKTEMRSPTYLKIKFLVRSISLISCRKSSRSRQKHHVSFRPAYRYQRYMDGHSTLFKVQYTADVRN